MQKWVGASGSKDQTVVPGQLVTYFLDFQVSDVSAFTDVEITDLLADGLEYVPGSAQLVSYTQHGQSLGAGAFDGDDVIYTVNADGTSTLTLDVSAHLSSDGGPTTLLGACVPAGFGGLVEACLISTTDESTVGRITYQARVLNSYRQPQGPDGSTTVVQNDRLPNEATIRGEIVHVGTGDGTGLHDSDPGWAAVHVGGSSTAKRIAYIAGEEVTSALPAVSSGDVVTFELEVNLSSLAFRNLLVTDFLPLPVFQVPGSMTFASECGVGAPPAAGVICYAPTSAFQGAITGAPGGGSYDLSPRPVTTNAVANSFTVDFGSFAPVSGTAGPTTLTLWASVEVADTALADGLIITNMVQAQDANSPNDPSIAQELVQLQYTRPVLNITNGVIDVGENSAYDATALLGAIDPPHVIGSGDGEQDRWDPIYDVDVEGLDARDVVTYIVVVENSGRGKNGAYDLVLRETLPTGLVYGDVLPGSLRAFEGTGAEYALPADAQADLFSSTGLTLTGNVLARGINEDSSVNETGSNILYLTYQVRLPGTSESGAAYTITSDVLAYAADDGGASMTSPGLIQDDVTVSVISPAIAKSIIATSEGHTGLSGGVERVAIGEIVRYRLLVDVAEGRTLALSLADALPNGLQYLPVSETDSGVRLAVVSQAVDQVRLYDDLAGAPWTVPTSATTAPAGRLTDTNSVAVPVNRVSQPGGVLTLNLGSVVNDAHNANVEQLLVEFNALVLNSTDNSGTVPAGNPARLKNNVATATHRLGDDTTTLTSNTVQARVFEPLLGLTKSASPNAGVDAGDSVVFTIVLSNGGAANAVTAFDIELTDVLPEHVSYDATTGVSFTSTGTVIGAAAGYDAGTDQVTLSATSLAPGSTITLTIPTTLDGSLPSGGSVVNTANVTASSLPGPNGTTSNPTGAATPGDTDETNGEREYELPASATVTVVPLQPSKSVVSTSHAHTTGSNVAIGEIVRYRVVVSVPEGVNEDFSITDTLPTAVAFAGDAMVSIMGTSLDVHADYAGAYTPGVCAVAAPTAEFPSGRLTVTPVGSGPHTSLFFDFDDITNNTVNDSASCIVIEYDVVILDHTANVNARDLTNGATASANGNSGPAGQATVTVVEPALTISKSVDAASAAGGADAGDTVTYRLFVDHASGTSAATAFDLEARDQIPNELDLDSVTVTFDPADLGASFVYENRDLVVTVPALALDEDLTITISGQLVDDLAPLTTVANQAVIEEYSSLPGVDPSERTYPAVQDEVDFTTQDISIAKAVVATSEAHTDGTDVVVGEIVRYRLSVPLPEGLISDLIVGDTVGAGLELVASAGVHAAVVAEDASDANPVTSNVVTGLPMLAATNVPQVLNNDNALALGVGVVTIVNNMLVVQLGDVTNAPGWAGAETLILEYNAVVIDVASNVAGASILNSATVATDSRTLPPVTATVTVCEPDLSITKEVVRGDSGYSRVVGDDLENADVDEQVTFRVTLSNAAAAGVVAAHNVNVSDVVPAEFELLSVLVTWPDGTDTTIDPATAPVDVDLATLAPGGSLTIDYTVLILAGLDALDEVENTASYTANTTQNPAGNTHNQTGSPSGTPGTYEGDDTATVTIGEPIVGLAKELVADPVTTDDGIYTFQYSFVVANLGELPLEGVTVTDDLLVTFPVGSGVTVTAATVSSVTLGGADVVGAINTAFNTETAGVVDTNLVEPGTLNLDVDEEAIILLDVTVQLADADALDTYDNTAFANGSTPGNIPADPDPSSNGGDPEGPETPTPVTFTEPNGLTLAKTFLPDELVSHGDGSFTVAYQISLTNESGVPLRQVQVTDDLSTVFGAASVIESAATGLDDSPSTLILNTNYDGQVDTELLDASASMLAAGATQSLTLTVRVQPTSTGESYTNLAEGEGTTPLGQTPEDDDGASYTFNAYPEITMGTCVTSVLPQAGGPTGTYTVTLSVRVENTGDLQLADSQATLNLETVFTEADSYTFVSVTPSGGAAVAANAAYGTAGDWTLLPAATTLYTDDQAAADASLPAYAQYEVVVTVVPGNELEYEVLGDAQGVAPVYNLGGDDLVTDTATDWCDYSVPPGDTPSIVDFDDEPMLGVAKRFVQLAAVAGQPGVFDVTFEFVLRNYGNAQLNGVELVESFDTTFNDGSTWEILDITTGTGTLQGATVASATADGNLLAAGSYLGSQGQTSDTDTVTLELRVTPQDPSDTYENTVAANATSPDGTPVTDDSVDGEDPDPDGDEDPTNNQSPTPFTFETPVIGVAKGVLSTFDFGVALGTDPEQGAVTNPLNVGNGEYLVAYEFTVRNYGDVPLSDVILTDDLATQLALGNPTAFAAVSSSVVGGTGTLTANPAYDGAAATNIFEDGQTLGFSEADLVTETVYVVVTLEPGAALVSGTLDLANEAAVQGTSPGGQDVTDDSNEGSDPDVGQPNGDDPTNDGDGDPTNNDGPTTITLTEAPAIAIAKQLVATENLGTGQYRVSFLLTVANVGDVNLSSVQVTDDLSAAFRGTPVAIETLSATGSLSAATDLAAALTSTELLDATASTLAVGQQETISLVVLVTPGAEVYGAAFENSALATGDSPSGAPVDDESNDGDTPDPDESSTTPIVLTEAPLIGVAKGVPATYDFGMGAEANPRNQEDGTYEVAYGFTVRNYGDVVLTDLTLTDDLLGQLATGNPVDVRAEDGSLTANPAYAGAAGVNLLAAGQQLDAAGTEASGGVEAGTVFVVVTLQPGAALQSGTLELQNQAQVEGTSPGLATPSDDSNEGFDPDNGQPEGDDPAYDGDGDPTNNDGPTTVVLTESPLIAAAKTVVAAENLGTGIYRVTYQIVVENQGDVNLTQVQVSDPFGATFRGSSYEILSIATAGPLTAAAPAAAQASDQLLDAATSALLVGESGTITVVLDVEPRAETYEGPFLNTATAEGTSPTGRVVEDDSNDGTTPDPTDDTPTPLTLTENPVLGVAKAATVTPVTDGSYIVQFDFTITNYGDVEVRQLQLTDDLDEAFGAGNHSVLSIFSPTLSTNSAAPDPDNAAAFDGSANQELLQGVDTLAVGATVTVQLRVRVTPAHMGEHENQADVAGVSPGERPVTDRSTDGLEPDPNGDGVPDEEEPTPVLFEEAPLIGLAKSAAVTMNDDGTFNVVLTFTVRNMGDVPLRGLQITDPIDGIYAITDLTPERIFVESSTLTVNPNYDGRTDSNILLGNDTLAVGAERQVTVRLENVTPTTGTATTNTAVATGTSPNGTPTEDRSTDGLEPDPNGDGVPDGDTPTPIVFEVITQVALAKSGSVAVAADGTFDVTFVLTVANTGNTSLHGVQVRDSLADYYANTDLTPAQVSISSSDFAVRAAYDGVNEVRMLMGTDSLAIDQSGTISITLTGITPNPGVTELENSAVANAAGPDGTPTDDTSNDGPTPEPGVDVPTVVELVVQPLLGVAKAASVVQVADGTYSVTFDFVLRNYGNVDLVNLSLVDDLADFYAQAGLVAANVSTSSASGLPLNPGYDGNTDTQILGAGATLAIGQTATVTLQLTGLTVGGPTNLTNQATAGGTTPSGVPTPPELSTNGPDPDPNGNDDPTDDSEPTPVFLTAEPQIGLAKRATVEQNADGSYRIEFAFVLANMGNTHLVNLSLIDDLAEFYTHTDLVPANVSVSSPDLTVNAGFDGDTDTQLLAPGNELALGASATVLLVLGPVNPLTQTRFENSATAEAESPDGTPTEDHSQDGEDPDPDDDGDPTNNDDPTPVVLEPSPRIGVAKSADVVANPDGSFDVTFEFVIGNYGNTVLENVQVRDDLSVFYNLTDLSAAHISVTSPDFSVNAGFDGVTDLRLLAPGNSLGLGESGAVTLTMAGFFISGPVDTFNTAVGTGTSPDGTPAEPDLSQDGPDPDPDGNGDPGDNSDPTPVRLGQQPRIGLAKWATNTRADDGTYTVEFTLLVRNYGDAPLANLSITDPLVGFYEGTNLSPERVSTSSVDLVLNPAYDGRADAELLAPGNRLGVGAEATLTITLVRLIPNEGVTRVDNLALARGTAPDGTEVADTSTDGTDPDPDGTGPNKHSTPTPVFFEDLAAMLLTKEVDEGPYSIGDRVPYTVTVINPNDVAAAFDLTDRLPTGTAYIAGTAAFDPASLIPSEGLEPRQDEPGTISWHSIVVPAGAQLRVTYELRVLPGAGDTLVNQVTLEGSTGFGAPIQATATAVAKVEKGVFELGKGLLIGRVYLDVDGNDNFQLGVDVPIEGARVILSNGWQALTDEQGNYAFRDLDVGSWTVMVDEITAPYRPSIHPEQLRDKRQHLVNVQGLTVSDFPFHLPEGLVGAERRTTVEFGPVTLNKRHVQLPDGVRVVLEIDFQGEWPAVLITDLVAGPLEDQDARTFVVEPSADPVVITYDLPLGTPLTDPEIEWSER